MVGDQSIKLNILNAIDSNDNSHCHENLNQNDNNHLGRNLKISVILLSFAVVSDSLDLPFTGWPRKNTFGNNRFLCIQH